jgi:hypothetical protein
MSISELEQSLQKGAIIMRLPRQAEPVLRGMEQSAALRAIAAQAIAVADASLLQGGINASGVEQCYNQTGLGRELCLGAFGHVGYGE